MLSNVVLLSLAASASAHLASWNPGMFCKGGNNSAVDDSNTNLVVNPLYMLPKSQWWMQADRGCDKVPPPDGEMLNIPSGETFTVEIADNRAWTTLSYGGSKTSAWPDGQQHPDDWSGPNGGKNGCLTDNPDHQGQAFHTHNSTSVGGTAWAISLESDITKVTMENLVVFTTNYTSPWHRLTSYEVPADMPACPPGGCYCAWLWIPLGCGQPNGYMQNHRCNVTGSTSSTKTLGVAQPPVYCADDSTKCVKGPKQMIAWNQVDGNNVVMPPNITPNYGAAMGYTDGAQPDILVDVAASAPSAPSSAPSSVAVSAPSVSTNVGTPATVTVTVTATPSSCTAK